MEKALIVGLDLPNSLYDIKYSLAELTDLALSDDILVVDVISQKLPHPNKAFYVGKGKVEEIKQSCTAYEVELVIFDDELSPSQMRNLERELNVKIIDRSFLILDIFAKRAKTNEAMLEIKLAQNRYLLPRLSGLHSDLSRQGGTTGGFSAKGPGEKQLELDKRHLMQEIYRAEEELARLKKMKESQARKRKENEVPVVALVGYTNAGKSSTMNTILEETNVKDEKMVYQKDELFATLNTFTRQVTYNKEKFLLVDTVGFVSKLPHHLVNSFRSTLEEIKNADLIIHVVDISSKYYEQQIHITNSVLASLGCEHIPTVYLLNKYDLFADNNHVFVGADNIPFSNKTKLNATTLLEYIIKKVSNKLIPMEVLIPYKNGDITNYIENNTKVISKLYLESGTLIKLEAAQRDYKRLSLYLYGNPCDMIN